MNQEFEIHPVKLVQDEISYGIAVDKGEGNWDVIASFKYPMDAVGYFAQLVAQLEQTVTSERPNENNKA